MLNEVNNSIKMSPSLTIFEDEKFVKLKQFCSGRVSIFIQTSLYRAVKLTFPRNISGLSQDDSIKNEMGQGSMGQVISVLSPDMFVPVYQA